MALVITFTGKKPSAKCFDFSVVGNAKVDVISFKLTSALDNVYTLEQLASLNAFVKVESAGKDYIDKISATSSYVSGQNPYVQIDFLLKKKTTQFRNVALQLQFEDNGGVVSQTEIVGLSLKGNINADEEIPDLYPSVLEEMQGELDNHEERIEALEGATVDAYTKEETNELLSHKVDKEQGKGLSTNDFTDSYKEQVEANTQKVSANDSKITIEKNGTKVDDFTLNQNQDKTINIIVPTQASDVNALPDTTKYGASLSLTINSSTYVITAQLKDQNGDSLGSAQTIDLPLESVVVSGSYDSQTKEVVLTLQNGSTIRFSVADLVSGLVSTSDLETALQNFYTKLETDNKLAEKQNVIDSSHKLASDLVDDTNQTNKFVNQSEKDKINATTLAGKGITDAYTKDECDAKYVSKVDLKIDCLPPVGDSTTLSGIGIQVKDAQDQVIATGTYNGTTLTFALPLNQTYKVEILTDSLTISGITYFAPEVDSGSAEGTLVQDESVVYRYSSTEHITTLSAVKQFLALPSIDLATKRLALVRTENNQFSVDIVIKNPANNTEYTMPLYILEVDNYTKLVEGVEQTFVGARVGFAYALPDSVPFDQREQVECASGETFQEGTYYYTATTTGIGDKAFTPLTAGTDYQNGDDIDTYKSTNNVFVFKHAWSNSQYGTGNKSTANLIRYGCNIFHKSNLFKWLNGSGDDWFVADHLGDTISGSWFEGKKGFKDWLKSTDLALIEQDVAYGVYEIDNATLPNNKVYAQFVVPSGTEIAGSVNNNEGTVFDYWKYLNGGIISNSANANRTVVKVSNLTSKQNTWLRSPYRNYSYYAWCVNGNGSVSGTLAYYPSAVLPLFTI